MTATGKLVLALVALNLALILVGLGRGDSAKCDKDVCVGLVFDVGGLGDKSFNDAAYRGLVRAEKELGIGFRYIEPGDGSDRESAIRQLVAQGYDVVFGIGFIFTSDMLALSKEFPDTKFACIDFSVIPGQPAPPDNLAGLRFREHEGAFLVGAIAAMTSKTQKVGFVGGMDIPLIRKFHAGYQAGVKHVCPSCTVYGSYAGTDGSAFADPTRGKELALSQYGRGADVIFHAAGSTGLGVFNAAKRRGTYAIGVDSDQFADAPCCVLTSMVKKVDVVVYDTIAALQRGEWKGGVQEFGLAEEGVGFVYDHNNRAMLTDEVHKKAQGLRDQIIRGDIRVPETTR